MELLAYFTELDMHYAGFEVLTVVVRMSSIFWDIMAHTPLRESTDILTHRFHLYG
jgi:hypothetical protein